MIVKPFNNAGGYTTFDNYILDYVMPNCKPNTWKVVCATLRKTKGWQKYSDVISFSQYMELTGIKNRTTMNDAIQDALNSGYIVRIPNGQSFSYALNRDLEIEIPEEPVQKSDQNQYGNRTTTSTETVHTKERIKERKKDSRRSPQPPPPPDEHPSAPNPDTQAVAHLEQVFSEERGVPPPDWTRPKEAQKTWRTPCRTMLNLCHGDVDRAEAELRATIRDMKRDKLTFTKPIQVLECFTSRLADQSAPAPTARPAAVWS
jgi:hypothetical protein